MPTLLHSVLRTPHSVLRIPNSALRTPHSLGVAGIAKGWTSTTERSLETVGNAHPTTPHSALRIPHSEFRTPNSESARALEPQGSSASWIRNLEGSLPFVYRLSPQKPDRPIPLSSHHLSPSALPSPPPPRPLAVSAAHPAQPASPARDRRHPLPD